MPQIPSRLILLKIDNLATKILLIFLLKILETIIFESSKSYLSQARQIAQTDRPRLV